MYAHQAIFTEIYGRLLDATQTRTQVELADFLEIRQSSISDSKRRQSIPAEWHLKLLEKGRISPIWLKTGRGPRMMIPQIWGRDILEKINGKGTLRRIRERKNVPTLPDAQTPVLPTASAEDKALLPALPCGAGALMPIKPLERRDAVTAVKAEAEVTAPSCALSAWMNRFGYLINEYYRLEKAGVPDERFPDCLKRLYRITDTESPDELAAVLACPPVQVEEAVRRSRIPAWWLLYLAARQSISPQWLLTGEGTPFFAPRHLPDHR